MFSTDILTILRRELAAVRRSIEAYPDEASLWQTPPGAPNAGGTLVLHIAGNLQHYVGAVLGGSGYVRDRDAEFARRGLSRDTLLDEVDATHDAIAATTQVLTDDALAQPYPERFAGRAVSTGDLLVHLAAHLAYHLGQLDYHRRLVTGDRRSIGALPIAELPTTTPPTHD